MNKSTNDKTVLGWREWVEFPELAIDNVVAKIDSGAKTSSLHAFNIHTFEEDGKRYAHSDIHPVQNHRKLIQSCRGFIVDQRDVQSSSGEKEQRLVIKTPMTLGDRFFL